VGVWRCCFLVSYHVHSQPLQKRRLKQYEEKRLCVMAAAAGGGWVKGLVLPSLCERPLASSASPHTPLFMPPALSPTYELTTLPPLYTSSMFTKPLLGRRGAPSLICFPDPYTFAYSH